jgi:hypothetical protein
VGMPPELPVTATSAGSVSAAATVAVSLRVHRIRGPANAAVMLLTTTHPFVSVAASWSEEDIRGTARG